MNGIARRLPLPLTPEALKAACGESQGVDPAHPVRPTRDDTSMHVDAVETVFLALGEGALAGLDVEHPDLAAYFCGRTATFPAFRRVSGRCRKTGQDAYFQAGSRLFHLAMLTRPFDWVDDPRMGEWERLLADLETGGDADPVSGSVQYLWDGLFALARAERFSEGTLRPDSVAQVRMANEIRRRLLGEPG